MKKTLMIFAVGLFVGSGIVLADNASKAKELREKGAKDWAQANVDHEKAVADFDAAIALQYKSDQERAEARRLFWEAYLLDRSGRKEWLEHAIKAHELRVKHLEAAIKSRKNYANHLEGLIKSEEKSVADLKAAAKAETNGKTKAGEELLIGND